MLPADKLNIVKQAMTMAANKLSNTLPQQQLLRLCAALISRMEDAERTKRLLEVEESQNEESQIGVSAMYITLSTEWVQHMEQIVEFNTAINRQMRAIRENPMQAVA